MFKGSIPALVTPMRADGAIDFQAAHKLRSQTPNASKEHAPLKLKLVNIGSGTTGTSFIFKLLCKDLHLQGYHWWTVCPGFAFSPLVFWWNYIKHCVLIGNQLTEYACKTNSALNMLDFEVKRMVNEIETLSDSPVDVIYAEYAPLFDRLLKVQTLRNPTTWAARRPTQHPGHTIMCRPEVYALGLARHVFDIPACLKSKVYIHEALMVESDLKRIAEGYIQMNTYNAAISKNLHIICVWDEDPEITKGELNAVWKHYSKS